jgi:peptide/nickel transport system permease protein
MTIEMPADLPPDTPLESPTHTPGHPSVTPAHDTELGAPVAETASDVRREVRRQLLRSRTFIVGWIIVLFWVFCAIAPGVVASDDPTTQNPLGKWIRPFTDGHVFGTDRAGRDVFSRAIYGAREIMIIAPAATVLGTVLGVILGLAMGYMRGVVDDVLSRIIEALISLPVILVALLALTSLSAGRGTIVAVIGFLFAPLIARTVRAAVLVERSLDYVRAAELRSEKSLYIMFAEILPNVIGPIIVEFTVRLGYAVFTMAGLAFIGFGSQPGSPDWGRTISDERTSLLSNVWWPALVPAIALASLVVAINLIADSIQGVVDR